MVRLFAERWSEVQGRGGARMRLAIEAVGDVLGSAAAEWSRVFRDGSSRLLREGMGMDGWIQDVRFGVRSLLRRPGFTAAAVVTLALGIGANVAIFSVVDGVLLKPLPYPDADRLIVLWPVDTRDGSRGGGVDHPDVRIWQEEVPELRVAAYAGSRPTLTGFGDPEVIYTAQVTDGLLEVFGLQPVLGRDVRGDEDVPDGPNVVMVSHTFWNSRLGGDPDVLGSTLQLSGDSWEIVGVAPEGFDFPNGAMAWTPRHHDDQGCFHGCRYLRAVGRLSAETTPEQVQERLDAISARLAEEHPDAHRDSGVAFASLLDEQVSGVRVALWVLMGAVAMVLLIACANVANLLLVRAGDRVGEVALRATLGAPRLRLVRQLLTESMLLAFAGGAGGVLLAVWGLSALIRMAPEGIPRLDTVHADGAVLGYALLIVLVVTVVFGLAPALHLARKPLHALMGGTRRTPGGGRTGMSRSLLLSGEVALSLMLLLGAGLLFGTLRQIRATDLGFDAENVERFRLSVPDSRYDVEGQIRFLADLEDRLAALPEVDAVGYAFGAPLGSGNIGSSVNLLDRDPVDPADEPDMTVRPASPGYREAMAIPLIRGRWIEATDVRANEGVVVLNQAAVDAYYPDMDPLGRRIAMGLSWGYDDDPPRTVVGVVGNTRTRSATEPDVPTAYFPNAQFGVNSVYMTMRLARGARSALPSARQMLEEMDPSLAITDVSRLEDVVADELASTRFYLTLLGGFSVLALILASVGLYGVVAFAVSRRTREIGIRVALGAKDDDVVGMVVREGMAPALFGVVIGLGGSLLAGRALTALLYGVEPNDPVTIAAVTAILLVVALAATLLPARRASRIPPSTALRTD
jgi:predicted permease